MSKALKCDRCGDLYEPYEAIPNQFYITQRSFNAEALDLCEHCSFELQDWMNQIRFPKCEINGLRCEYCTKRNECTEDMAVEYRRKLNEM